VIGTRTETCLALLRALVARSREAQATSGALAALGSAAAGRCGLGERAELELDLPPAALEHARALWPAGAPAEQLAFLREEFERVVREQDALDRRRNHFLKSFRGAHGPDRRAWDAALLGEYERGLDEINGEQTRALEHSAARIAAL
jgi:hypothetical protein